MRFAEWLIELGFYVMPRGSYKRNYLRTTLAFHDAWERKCQEKYGSEEKP